MRTSLDLGVVGVQCACTRRSRGGAMKAWAVALAVGLQLPAACDTASGSGMHARGGLSGAAQESAAGRHLGLRGGSAPGYSGLPDEELLEEPRSAQELWDTVYSRPGVITLCNAAGFDTAVVGQHLVIEHAGAHARNFEYGYSCARSAAVAKDMAKGKDTSSASSTRRKRSKPPHLLSLKRRSRPSALRHARAPHSFSKKSPQQSSI